MGLNVVVLTSSSRYLALGMCTDINVPATGTQGSSTDLQQYKLCLSDVYWLQVSDTGTPCSSTDL